MRPIDADALWKDFISVDKDDIFGLEDVEEILDNAPTIESCEDAISREAVIEEIRKPVWKIANKRELIAMMDFIPSVAPKHSGEATEMVEDAISIEVAIQTTWMILNGMGYPKDQNEELDQTIKAVFDTAPRVAPSRPSGEWIDKGWKGDWQFETDGRGNCWHEYECSECGFHNKGSKSNFCPNCGAHMKGADDE